MWYGLRNMVHYFPEEMKTGGVLWFVDLSQPDELGFLPMLSCTGLFVMGEIGADHIGRPTREQSFRWRWGWRVFRLFSMFILVDLPAGLHCYFIPNSAMSIAQTIILSQPAVKEYLTILQSDLSEDDKKMSMKQSSNMRKTSAGDEKIFATDLSAVDKEFKKNCDQANEHHARFRKNEKKHTNKYSKRSSKQKNKK